MGSPRQVPRVYTLPDCHRCETLKARLGEVGREFQEVRFDTDAHVEFIMRNVFGNPPILEVGHKAFASEELFVNDLLDEVKFREALDG